MRALALLLASMGLLSGCGDETIPPCPDGGTALSYESFGRAFLDDNCNYCHAAGQMSRQGAPYEYTFDSLAEVKQHRQRIWVRSTGDRPSMPPGPSKPPAEERARLAEWLQCIGD